ncbi:hypothetical protein F5Y19DRAFT_488010 [Xylariaceae sp. FL1651]|nr:hypothetical protein F5Y19DRAFT_488010 [Xylariaceae sp. FL1651]
MAAITFLVAVDLLNSAWTFGSTFGERVSYTDGTASKAAREALLSVIRELNQTARAVLRWETQLHVDDAILKTTIKGMVVERSSELTGDATTDFLGGNATHGGAYPAGGPRADDDFRGAAEHASRHAGDSGDTDLFSNLLGSLGQKKQKLANEDLDEDEAVRTHKKYFQGEDDDNDADDRSMGSAAAMQALKMFSGGQSGNTHESSSQSAFIGLAMGEASKLFDQKASQGKVSSGSSKESAVMQAGEMALKMYMKSQGGGHQSSGASGLLGLASKFM